MRLREPGGPVPERDQGPEEDPAAPTGAVLGPLPLWAGAAVVGAAAGEWLGHLGAPTGVFGGAALAGCCLALALATAGRESGSTSAACRGAGATVAVLVVMAGVAGLRVDTLGAGLLPDLAGQGGAATLSATVAQEPRDVARGWHVDLRVGAVDGVATRERAALVLDEDHEPPGLGQRWQLEATARPLPEGGYGRWLAGRHARVLLDPVTIEPVGAPGWAATSSEHVRARIRRAATAHNPPAVGGLLVGLVTGDTRHLPDEDERAMQATSLTHLTAVSGTHVAILVAGVLGLCGLVRVGARGRRWTVGVTILGFAYLTRFEPSVLRASTMAGVVLLAFARGVPRDARHALAGAVLVLVLIDPMLAGSLGLLLSATATAGVLVVAPRVRERLERVRRLPRRVADLLAVTIGAQITVVPLLLVTFEEVRLASVPANLLAVPFGALAAALGFLGAAVSTVSVDAASVVYLAAGVPARVVLLVADRLADAGGVVDATRPAAVLALAATAAWLCTRPGSRSSRVGLGLALSGVVAAGVPVVVGPLPVQTLAVTAIDVGQGDAFLVESPGARLLVDAGEDSTAARWLRGRGRPRIDVAIVTHPHLDHVGGMADVLRTVTVGAVWYRPMPNELAAVDDLLQQADEDRVPVAAPSAGQRATVGDLVVEVLGPPPGRPYRFSGSELNDSSIVVRVHWGDRRVLLTGDAEHAAQRDLLEHPDLLRAEAFTVPHHGAATSEEEFLRAVGAQVGLIGVGEDNRHGHPTPEVLDLLEALDVEIVRTDLHGTTRVEVPPPLAGVAVATGPVDDRSVARDCPARRQGPSCGHADAADRPPHALALPAVTAGGRRRRRPHRRDRGRRGGGPCGADLPRGRRAGGGRLPARDTGQPRLHVRGAQALLRPHLLPLPRGDPAAPLRCLRPRQRRHHRRGEVDRDRGDRPGVETRRRDPRGHRHAGAVRPRRRLGARRDPRRIAQRAALTGPGGAPVVSRP